MVDLQGIGEEAQREFLEFAAAAGADINHHLYSDFLRFDEQTQSVLVAELLTLCRDELPETVPGDINQFKHPCDFS